MIKISNTNKMDMLIKYSQINKIKYMRNLKLNILTSKLDKIIKMIINRM